MWTLLVEVDATVESHIEHNLKVVFMNQMISVSDPDDDGMSSISIDVRTCEQAQGALAVCYNDPAVFSCELIRPRA